MAALLASATARTRPLLSRGCSVLENCTRISTIRSLSSASSSDGSSSPHSTARKIADILRKRQNAVEDHSTPTPFADEKPSSPQGTISIDRSGLFQSTPTDPEILKHKEEETELGKYLRNKIKYRGPISVADYIKECLLHPTHGYYMYRDVFGRAGDFITSPEISQMFGEMIGIWFVSMWQLMECPEQIRLVEMGPGRGTLMADILRATSRFPEFSKAIRVSMMEASPALRHIQKSSLTKAVSSSSSSPLPAFASRPEDDSASSSIPVMLQETTLPNGIQVTWHNTLDDIPEGMPMLTVAQEFFDALPVFQFELTENGWREKLVDLDDSPDSPHHFRFVLSPVPTPACSALLATINIVNAKVGDGIEICASGMGIAQDLAKRISKDNGAALLIDYGHDRAMKHTVQGIREHKFVNIFSKPGQVDLSTFVDFAALGRAVRSLELDSVVPLPLQTQGLFLREMGIDARLSKLLLSCTKDSQSLALTSAYDRLTRSDATGERYMGSKYKVLGITRSEVSGAVPGFATARAYELEVRKRRAKELRMREAMMMARESKLEESKGAELSSLKTPDIPRPPIE